MRLWLIDWEDFSGEEHRHLVAARTMGTESATAHALAYMRRIDKSFDATDICYIGSTTISKVKDSAGKKYTITLTES